MSFDDPNERPSTEERYARAINSSHLRLQERRLGDADILIAAGKIPDKLATAMLRLAKEYDSARGRVAQLRSRHSKMEDSAIACGRTATRHLRQAAALQKLPDSYLAWLDAMLAAGFATEKAKCIRADALREAKTERLLALASLKSLVGVKQGLLGWAAKAAARWNFMPQPEMPAIETGVRSEAMNTWWAQHDERGRIIAVLVGGLLEALLDDACDSCSGRGYFGGHGTRQMTCAACAGKRRRSAAISRDAEQEKFLYRLTVAIGARTITTSRDIGALAAGRIPLDDLLRKFNG